MIIAIDGPAAAGKGTLAKNLSRHLGMPYLETGLLYRAVGLKTLKENLSPEEAADLLQAQELNNPELRGDEAAGAASKVAAIPAVRAKLLEFQRNFAAQGGILDGRDIGTIVCPQADAKIFITATVEARAQRRFKELQAASLSPIYVRVLADMKERDARDSQRAEAPLKPAADAFILDTSGLDAEAVLAEALAFIEPKVKTIGANR